MASLRGRRDAGVHAAVFGLGALSALAVAAVAALAYTTSQRRRRLVHYDFKLRAVLLLLQVSIAASAAPFSYTHLTLPTNR